MRPLSMLWVCVWAWAAVCVIKVNAHYHMTKEAAGVLRSIRSELEFPILYTISDGGSRNYQRIYRDSDDYLSHSMDSTTHRTPSGDPRHNRIQNVAHSQDILHSRSPEIASQHAPSRESNARTSQESTTHRGQSSSHQNVHSQDPTHHRDILQNSAHHRAHKSFHHDSSHHRQSQPYWNRHGASEDSSAFHINNQDYGTHENVSHDSESYLKDSSRSSSWSLDRSRNENGRPNTPRNHLGLRNLGGHDHHHNTGHDPRQHHRNQEHDTHHDQSTNHGTQRHNTHDNQPNIHGTQRHNSRHEQTNIHGSQRHDAHDQSTNHGSQRHNTHHEQPYNHGSQRQNTHLDQSNNHGTQRHNTHHDQSNNHGTQRHNTHHNWPNNHDYQRQNTHHDHMTTNRDLEHSSGHDETTQHRYQGGHRSYEHEAGAYYDPSQAHHPPRTTVDIQANAPIDNKGNHEDRHERLEHGELSRTSGNSNGGRLRDDSNEEWDARSRGYTPEDPRDRQIDHEETTTHVQNHRDNWETQLSRIDTLRNSEDNSRTQENTLNTLNTAEDPQLRGNQRQTVYSQSQVPVTQGLQNPAGSDEEGSHGQDTVGHGTNEDGTGGHDRTSQDIQPANDITPENQTDFRHEPCCGSVVPLDLGRALSTGEFHRVAPGGSVKVVAVPLEESDNYPPGKVRDLRVSPVGLSTVALTWTTPGDDLDHGTVSSYIIRVSSTVIDLQEAQFDQAPEETLLGTVGELEDAGVFVDAGVRAEVRVPVPGWVRRGQVYYVALKALDEHGQQSPVSNMARFSIPGPVEEQSVASITPPGHHGEASQARGNIRNPGAPTPGIQRGDIEGSEPGVSGDTEGVEATRILSGSEGWLNPEPPTDTGNREPTDHDYLSVYPTDSVPLVEEPTEPGIAEFRPPANNLPAEGDNNDLTEEPQDRDTEEGQTGGRGRKRKNRRKKKNRKNKRKGNKNKKRRGGRRHEESGDRDTSDLMDALSSSECILAEGVEETNVTVGLCEARIALALVITYFEETGDLSHLDYLYSAMHALEQKVRPPWQRNRRSHRSHGSNKRSVNKRTRPHKRGKKSGGKRKRNMMSNSVLGFDVQT